MESFVRLTAVAFVWLYSITQAESRMEEAGSIVLNWGKPLLLSCNVPESSDEVTWMHNEEEILPEEGHYIMHHDNNTLEIKHAVRMDTGDYKCIVQVNGTKNYTDTVTVEAEPRTSFDSKSKDVVEGDTVIISCFAFGLPSPNIQWYKGEDPLDLADDRYSFMTFGAVTNATLQIEKTVGTDRADYMCVASNRHGSANATVLIRVRGRLEALWPFLGILAEFIILFIIIFISERYFSKKAHEEADLNNSHPQPAKKQR